MEKESTENIKDRAIKAALELAATQGWGVTSLADIATAAEIPLSRLHEYFEDRFDILTAYGRMIDNETLDSAGTVDQSLSPRERLFDLLMARFDVLNKDRAGVCAILKSFCFDPKQTVISLPHLGRSMSWMLEAAGISTAGLKGAVKVAGLTGLYLKTVKIWKDDDSPDMAKTMAALDQYLDRAERWAVNFGL